MVVFIVRRQKIPFRLGKRFLLYVSMVLKPDRAAQYPPNDLEGSPENAQSLPLRYKIRHKSFGISDGFGNLVWL